MKTILFCISLTIAASMAYFLSIFLIGLHIVASLD
jgi:hypothetical protein